MLSQTTTLKIRQMLPSDMDSIMQIQALCYSGDIPESRHAISAKLQASPTTCFVAQDGSQIIAYLIAVPWLTQAPPNLNAPTCVLPAYPDCLYLHDLSVVPSARGSKIGSTLVARLFDLCRLLSHSQMSLVAVQNSAAYWRRFGFASQILNSLLRDKLASYGEGSEFMLCQIGEEWPTVPD
jgi:predicted N-acetyltransferase YhbS